MAIDHDEEYRKIYGFYPPINPRDRYETFRVLSDDDGRLVAQYASCDGTRSFMYIDQDYDGDTVDISLDESDWEFYDEDGVAVDGLLEWMEMQ